MGDFREIADVGETLITLLRENMGPSITANSITLLSPFDVAENQNIRLTLFLYSVVENPYLKNQEMSNLNPTQLLFPPLSLDLYYLMTAYAPAQNTDVRLDEHEILGRAMRIFYDNAILSGSTLRGGLAGTSEDLRITLNPISLDDLTKLWFFFPGRPYRASVGYLVTPVRIDSARVMSTQRVVSKEMNHGYMVPK